MRAFCGMSLTPRQTALVACWRNLRQPFVLPRASAPYHTCAWERIEIDLYCCTLCSCVHACSESTCQDIVETEDGTVCCLSGIALRTIRFVEEEFVEHIHLTDFKQAASLFDEETCSSEIEQCVRLLLTSNVTRRLYGKAMLKRMDKLRNSIRTSACMLGVCVQKIVCGCSRNCARVREHPQTRNKFQVHYAGPGLGEREPDGHRESKTLLSPKRERERDSVSFIRNQCP